MRRRWRPLTVAVALTIGIVGALFATLGHGGSGRPAGSALASLSSAAAGLPPPERPAFVVGRPRRLRQGEMPARFAPVVHNVLARRGPSTAAAPVAELTLQTSEGTTNIVLVLGEVARADGQWIRIRLPVLPNGQTAWVPRDVLGGYEFVHTQLIVDRQRLRATLFYDGRAIFHAPVGIGRSDSPTPAGQFYIRDKLAGFGDPFYGPVAYGTSARSAILTDWPGGGFVGIHGTNEPELIPGRISHGCVRMRNSDILRLSRLMPVGTPLTIR